MCGIAGFLAGEWPGDNEAAAILRRMNEALNHRGPDDSGTWMDSDAGVGFAHNRLSILELSRAGRQPMQSHSGRHVIIYNGEIYNHLELREALSARGATWRGNSDTETFLEAIEHFGTRDAIERARGMFAFALWDRQHRSLTLARDRVGEKPLYYGLQGGKHRPFLFASELKALAKHPSFRGEIDRQALTLLLRFGYVPAPFSIYKGVRKLPPGSILTLNADSAEPIIDCYWSGVEVAKKAVANQFSANEEQIVNQLELLLEEIIAQQMLADVPVGAFLSGGIDSSTITALMQKLSSRPVRTFTIGFHETRFNEADHAKTVARHLGTDHMDLYVTPAEARNLIPSMPEIYDEPFADSSQIPTYLISALARKEVKVALSGDGGDELFGGYNRHLVAAEVWSHISRLPKWVRAMLARGLVAVPNSAWSMLESGGRALLPQSLQAGELPERISRGAPLLASNSLAELYKGIVSLWRNPSHVVIAGLETSTEVSSAFNVLQHLTPSEQFMAADLAEYLPNDILVKVDRAAMAVSLETRMPFLDHRLIEFAWRVPFGYKIKGRQTKAVLRRLLHRYVPEAIMDRPKMGFAVPVGEWLRGPLREWAETLLDPGLIRKQGHFRVDVLEKLWGRHLSGGADETRRLWVILMFQSWLQAQSPKPGENDARS